VMAAGRRAARTWDLILIRVLPGGLFPQDRTRDLRDDVPLETVANRSVPMACGPNVDQVGLHRVPGPVRSRTPLALPSSATRDRSAGRARQGRYSSSYERITYEDPAAGSVRGSSPLRQTRDGSGASDEGDRPLQVRPT
jgi:hypothetical protein